MFTLFIKHPTLYGIGRAGLANDIFFTKFGGVRLIVFL